ncbi:hypothetical protein CMU25_17265 [Elizabethkingia anophelis]|nr:hypothetical protein [Elizabethkingia anophelis]MDV3842073.1 hypothetical protein [Elizabethkingia anophelis]
MQIIKNNNFMKNNNFTFIFSFILILMNLLFSCQRDEIRDITATKRLSSTLMATSNMINIPESEYYVVDSLGKKVQFFSEYTSGGMERDRLQSTLEPTDFLPTGLYLEANQKLILNVDQINGSRLPILLIGTYGRTGALTTPQKVELVLGENTITANDKGGLLWIRYVNNGNLSSNKVKITFKEGYKMAPLFVKGRTNPKVFASQISISPDGVKDALLIGEKVYLVLQKGQNGLSTQNNDNVLEKLDSYLKIQEDLMGLDNSSQTHSSIKIQRLFTICIPPYAGGWADDYVAATSIDVNEDNNYLFTPRHEFGHTNEQSWVVQRETFAQFFAIATGLNTNIPADELSGGYGKWNNIWKEVDDYFKKPDKERDFTQAERSVPNFIGGGFLGAAMYIQLKLAFGNDFYQKLFKITRENKPVFINDDAKYKYFMIQACKITKTDLSFFFKKWGFNFPDAYTTIATMKFSKPQTDPSILTTDPNIKIEEIIESGATYQLVSAVNNTSVLDVAGAGTNYGTNVLLWSNNNSNNQKWVITNVENGYYILSPKHAPTMVLDVERAGTSNGTNVLIWNNNNSNNQKWIIKNIGNGYYTLSPKYAPTMALDVYNGNTIDGTKIQIYSANIANSQKWKLIKL